MSKKRTSSATSSDEPTNESSDSAFKEDEDAKRVKLISPSDTTLQDLPFEVMESILLEAVAMEVTEMKLARRVWIERADVVISRLGSVCWQWSSVLTTNFFHRQISRMLDQIAEEKIHLEILHQYPIQFYVSSMATLKDEVFLLHQPEESRDHVHAINVYDCNNMAEVKGVIQLPGLYPRIILACSVSNCVYVINRTMHEQFSIWRITRDNGCWSTASVNLFIGELRLPERSFGVTTNGSLILARQQSTRHAAISVFDANGSLQQEIRLSEDISRFRKIICKPNGNLVLVSHNDDQAKLTEIDMRGTKIRQYLWPLDQFGSFYVSYADNHGRMLIVGRCNGMKLLDSEFNPLDFTCPQQLKGVRFEFSSTLYFDSERNAAVGLAIAYDRINYDQDFVFVAFHLKEEVFKKPLE